MCQGQKHRALLFVSVMAPHQPFIALWMLLDFGRKVDKDILTFINIFVFIVEGILLL